MKTTRHLWSYLFQLFLERGMSQTEIVEKIKTHFTYNNLFKKNVPFMR
jgi:glutathionyl-hydroquinone reductase